MEKHLHKISLIFLAVFLLAQLPLHATAETRYVTDKLLISLRTGPGNDDKVIENISTGTVLTVLEDKGDFIKVSTANGKTGWVPKYYTETELPKESVIHSLNLEIKRMEQEAEDQAAILENFENTEEANNQNLAKISSLAKQLDELQVKYAALLTQSENIVETIKERDDLKKAAYSKDQEIRELSTENSSLKNYKMIYWLATGGGIFLLGWLIGKLGQRSNKRSLSL